ncbi:hypothetical protein Nepgr_012454 [Nepenthes gracilis]|uniref:Uncharacterized protein n=1 Tax=Nepenthes gracilis TaxID=150966 RepID=A0AAD3SG07_NEPGR|nr:hypothetical protein Nepgr_012454 [Nepenthes gracilis]
MWGSSSIGFVGADMHSRLLFASLRKVVATGIEGIMFWIGLLSPYFLLAAAELGSELPNGRSADVAGPENAFGRDVCKAMAVFG